MVTHNNINDNNVTKIIMMMMTKVIVMIDYRGELKNLTVPPSVDP